MEFKIRNNETALLYKRLGWEICSFSTKIRNYLMKVFLTGSNGFIGKYVLRDCLSKNLDVVPTVKNIKNVSKIYNFETKNLDIYKVNSNTFNDLGCPQNVIHLAWSGLPNYFSNRHFRNRVRSTIQFP